MENKNLELFVNDEMIKQSFKLHPMAPKRTFFSDSPTGTF